jgi:hypothetical protein
LPCSETGIVTFAARHVAAAGVAVTAGLYFDVTVRFGTDHLSPSPPGLSRKFRWWKSGRDFAVWLPRMTTASPAPWLKYSTCRKRAAAS